MEGSSTYSLLNFRQVVASVPSSPLKQISDFDRIIKNEILEYINSIVYSTHSINEYFMIGCCKGASLINRNLETLPLGEIAENTKICLLLSRLKKNNVLTFEVTPMYSNKHELNISIKEVNYLLLSNIKLSFEKKDEHLMPLIFFDKTAQDEFKKLINKYINLKVDKKFFNSNKLPLDIFYGMDNSSLSSQKIIINQYLALDTLLYALRAHNIIKFTSYRDYMKCKQGDGIFIEVSFEEVNFKLLKEKVSLAAEKEKLPPVVDENTSKNRVLTKL